GPSRPPSFLRVLRRRVEDLLLFPQNRLVARFAVDVTACWRPQRVGMLTVAIELTRALVANRGEDEFTLLCSRERPASLAGLDCEAVLAPYRHELALKTSWLPAGAPKLGW